ncbi:MAG: DUF91 domain-containing protein [Chitinophagaceae bacterium]|nr:MAG: DUF91 domain-containing protein [Chitinophagaceae bacterium]
MKMHRYLGKGQYQEVTPEELSELSDEEIKGLRELPGAKAVRQPKDIFKEINEVTTRSGYKVITVMKLVKLLGNKKRSPQIIEKINQRLRDESLYVYPKLSMTLRPDEILRIYTFPVEALGDLFDTEEELESYIEEKNLFGKLGLEAPQRQFSPDHTRDRLDFKCCDLQGNHVALELKNLDGGKSAVEQVLRYLGILKQHFRGQPVRGILVTGVRGVDTAKALHGMTDEQKKAIDWYLYSYSKGDGNLSFEKVEYTFLDQNLQRLTKTDNFMK